MITWSSQTDPLGRSWGGLDLRSHGCDRIQGFLAAPPLPAEDFADLLRSGEAILPSEISPKPPARATSAAVNPSLLPRLRS